MSELIQTQTVYDFRRFRKKIRAADLISEPLSDVVLERLKKRKSTSRTVFIALVAISFLFYAIFRYLFVEDEIFIYALLGFLTLTFGLSFYVYNRYNRDIANGRMDKVSSEIIGVMDDPNPFRSKVKLRLGSGDEFYMPRAAFPKELSHDQMIGANIEIIYASVSHEVLIMRADSFEMVGYK